MLYHSIAQSWALLVPSLAHSSCASGLGCLVTSGTYPAIGHVFQESLHLKLWKVPVIFFLLSSDELFDLVLDACSPLMPEDKFRSRLLLLMAHIARLEQHARAVVCIDHLWLILNLASQLLFAYLRESLSISSAMISSHRCKFGLRKVLSALVANATHFILMLLIACI